MAQIEHMRCKHRMRVLQGHEDTTKQNVVSRGPLRATAPGGQVLTWAASAAGLPTGESQLFFCIELTT